MRFDTKRAPDGSAWLPLSATTIEIYTSDWFIARNPAFAGGIPGSLLERTRFMRDSLTHNVGANYVEWGFSDPKAAHHEYGTRKMPRRQMLTDDPVAGTLAEGDRADLLDEVQRYLSELL
jgi:phage gpG-like protein